MIFEIKHVNRMRPMLRHLVLLLFSLYVLNAIGAIESLNGALGGRRYLNVLWGCLFCFYFLERKEIDLSLFKTYFLVLLPIIVTCFFLYFYHGCAFDLGYVKYALLFLLAGSVYSNAKNFNLRTFFVVGSLSCVAIFLVALYQIDVLGYLVPNGDLN